MLWTGLRHFLKHPIHTVTSVAADPLEAWVVLYDVYVARGDQPVPADLYEADGDWEHRLNDLIGAQSSQEADAEFQILWPKVIEELQAKGVRVGPESFKT